MKLNLQRFASESIEKLNVVLPNAMTKMGTANVNDNIYLIGGLVGTDSTSSDIYKFNPSNREITLCNAKIPTGFYSTTNNCVAVGKCIYMFGGSTIYDKYIQKYDTENDTCTVVYTFNYEWINGLGLAVIANDIYLIGGWKKDKGASKGSYLTSIYKFNTLNNTLSNTGISCTGVSLCTIVKGTDIYMFGGTINGSSNNAVRKFDTETNTITVLSTTIPFTGVMKGVIIDNYIYLIKAEVNYNQTTINNEIYKFNVLNNSIEKLDITFPDNLNGRGWATNGINCYGLGGNTVEYSSTFQNVIYKLNVTPTSYTITDNLTNVSAAGSNVYQIDKGGTRSLTYSWSTQFVVGVNNINVVNADYTPTFNGNSVTLALSNPSGNVTINITASEGNFEFNITSNGTTTLATKNTYVPCDIDFNVNVPSVPLQEKSEYITSNTQTIITPDTGKALSKVTITTDVPQMTEVATSAEMDAKLNENNVSLYYKYTGTTDDKYTNGDIYQVQEG